MSVMSLENLKKNMNIGWILLLAYLAVMAFVYLLARPQLPLGTEMFTAIIALLLIGLSLEG